MMRYRGGWCLPVFLSIFVLVGIGLIVWGARILKNSSLSSDWPTTQGEIVASSIRESKDDDGTTYHADVRFAYVVDDQRHTGDTVSFGQYGSGSSKHAAGIVSRYPTGKTVMVYYDPQAPATAVLEPGVTWSSYLVLGIGLIFTVLPGIIMVIAILRLIFR